VAEFAVTAIGADRPGIVAAVTAALAEAGCNLEDSSMTILGGHFAILLLLEAPDTADGPTLEAALAPAATAFGLVVSVQPVGTAPAEAAAEPAYTATVYGADRPGIVNRVTEALASLGVNIVDLTTRVIGSPEAPVYAMLLDLTLPSGVERAQVAQALNRVSEEIGVDTSLHEAQPDIF